MTSAPIARAAISTDRHAIDRFLTRYADVTPRKDPAIDIHRLHGAGRHGQAVLEAAGSILGVATLYERDLHPYNQRVAIHVEPDGVDATACSRLLETCLHLRNSADQRPILLATREDDRIPLHAAATLGFTPLMRTFRGTIHLTANDTDPEPSLPSRLRMNTLAETPGEAHRRRLALAHARIYREAHTWNPARHLTTDEAVSLFLHPTDTLPDHTFSLHDRTTIVGVASLRPTDPGADNELGWIGVLRRDRDDRGYLIPALLAICLRSAQSRDSRAVRYEIDANEDQLWQAVQRYPLTAEPDWVTVVLR
jgi:hypothetical protein